MVYYDTGSRLQLGREHAVRPAAEMRRSRRLTPQTRPGSPAGRGWPRPWPASWNAYAGAGDPHSCL